MAGLRGVIREARRRRVFRIAGIYIVAAWVAVQVASEAFPAFDIPAGAILYVWLGGLIGLPIAVVFGWFYDLTAEGIVRTAPADAVDDVDLGLRRTDYVLISALVVVAVTAVYRLTGEVREQGTAGPAPGVADPLSIGVLPLDNLSGDPEQLYFANGMHDALISDLSRVSGLHVTSRTSTRAYAESEKTVATICAELGISKVIEGSVYRVEDKVRVNVQLIDCGTDDHLWTQTYDRKLSDVLIMQSEITRSIAREVEVALTAEESALLAGTAAVDPASYESYLKGMFHLDLFTPRDMQLAVEFFARALELDPGNALAHWGLGRACRFQLQFGHGRPREREPECREHLLAALQTDPELPQVHLGLALGYWLYDYDWDAAETSFERALALNPNYAEAHMFYSHLLACLLRRDESEHHIQRAVTLDPVNIFVLGLHAAQQQLIGRLDNAVAMLGRLHEEVPNFGFGYDVVWFSSFGLGDLDAALEAAKKTYSVTIGIPAAVGAIERGYATDGYDGAMLALGAVLEKEADSRYVPGVFIAIPFAMAGNADKAVEWLEKAFDQHDPMMPYVAAVPSFSRVSGDPRYGAILERMKLRR